MRFKVGLRFKSSKGVVARRLRGKHPYIGALERCGAESCNPAGDIGVEEDFAALVLKDHVNGAGGFRKRLRDFLVREPSHAAACFVWFPEGGG